MIAHIKAIAPAQNDGRITQFTKELTCRLCSGVLNQPIELTECESLVCAQCLCKWLREEGTLCCPCCSSDHLGDFTKVRAATVVQRILASLMESPPTTPPSSQQPDTIQEIIDKPSNSPLDPIEEQLQTALVKRSLKTSGDGTNVRVKTGGQVSNAAYTHVYDLFSTHTNTCIHSH